MKTIVILAMHGAPPNDFPKHELAEFFSLYGSPEHTSETDSVAPKHRYAELEASIRAWPRTEQNDPFYHASQDLAIHLSRATGHEVIVGFHEFCAPNLDEALEQAITQGVDKVIVITPMMTRGGEHSEVDIAAAVERAKTLHPDIPIIYAWPFEVSEIAQFLASQIARFA